MPDVIIAIILGLVEGLTEFIPVSSTGHLIVVGSLLDFTGDRAETFEVFIQLGAILAVAWVYRQRLWSFVVPGHRDAAGGMYGARGLALIATTTAPALVLGALFHRMIRDTLFTPWMVAIAWFVGGLAILAAERLRPPTRVTTVDGIGWRYAILIGLFQCVSLWPGMSRSASTMVGGLILGVQRPAAAEYSFLCAIPIIAAASLFELVSNISSLGRGDIPLFAIGFGVSFVSAWVAVVSFLRLLQRISLAPFGWYRLAIASGVMVLLWITPGVLSV